MIPHLLSPFRSIAGRFRRSPSKEEALFAEAQALLEDGLDVDFVLGLYPDDAEWLEPLLRTADHITSTIRAEEPSYFFEASLKNRFLAAGQERARERQTGPRAFLGQAGSRMRGAAAGMAVVASAGIVGIATLGFVTADQAVPGDWNYAFKRAGERVEYVLASEPERVTIDLKHKQERITEFQRMGSRGQVTSHDIERLRHSLEEVITLEQDRSLDPVQRAHVRAISESTTEILNSIRERQPELGEAVDDTMTVVAAIGGNGEMDELAEPEPTPEPTREPPPTATPEPDPTDTPAPTRTPTAEPTPTETPEATATPTPTPDEDEEEDEDEDDDEDGDGNGNGDRTRTPTPSSRTPTNNGND